MADPVDISGLVEGHARSTYRPVKRRDVRRVLRNYGVRQKASKRAGKSDSQLYKFATKTVIDWFKRQQKEPKPEGTAPGTGNGSGGGAGSAAPGAGGSSGGGASGGPMLPDTAMGSGGGPGQALPPIRDRRADTNAQIDETRRLQRETRIAPPAIRHGDILAGFQRFGIKGVSVSSVPASARKSPQAWSAYLYELRKRYGDLKPKPVAVAPKPPTQTTPTDSTTTRDTATYRGGLSEF